MKLSLNGYNAKYATFKLAANSAAAEGNMVKVTGSYTVDKAGDGNVFAGLLIHKTGSAALVQTGGYMNVPYTGTAPAYGYNIIACNATGGIKTNSTGIGVTVVDIDTDNSTVGIIL
ncbi:hypothetical protein [Youxingia wuxianensis]|uniref:Uncharacterized protein n=1 Tax=Youxingia wuxianensis TaxID=2763678 RepID=A0A926ES36_9FIRM|nr:hypothetical protein [Youxingia wuxianensis]MBC8585324.1 hypothetical protein [Youxingia wuxianensis]